VAAALAGYVYLQAQTAHQPTDPTETIRQELRPLIARIEQLEARISG
jgi:ATP-dependent Clp protease ATP-binding subunit ClpC